VVLVVGRVVVDLVLEVRAVLPVVVAEGVPVAVALLAEAATAVGLRFPFRGRSTETCLQVQSCP
jgi:hypothetical protein